MEGHARGSRTRSPLTSHRRRCARIEAGEFKDEITPYDVVERVPDLATREVVIKRASATATKGRAPDTTPKALAKLQAGVRRARAASPPATARRCRTAPARVILMSEAALKRFNLTPLARFVGFAVAGVPPEIMGIGPIKAIPKVLQQVGPQAGRHRLDRAERSVRRAVARGDQGPRARSGEGQSAGRRDRARPSARRDRRDPRGDARARPAPAASRSTAWSRCASAPAWARPACSSRSDTLSA